MKKSLFLSITGITLVALTATTLYAQTTTGNSVISKMKAAVSAFTLAGDLNPGQTGLQSAPVSGKKTGDILTAGEWNRVLEIIASAGGGVSDVELITSQAASPAATADYSFRVSQANCPAWKKIISGGCSYPNTLNTFVHNTPTPDLTGWICGGLHHDGDTTNNATKYPYRPTAYAVCGTYGSGGGSGGNGEMVMSEMSPTAYMNLIDAVDYCRNLTENGITHWRFPTYGDLVNFIDPKYSQDMIWVADFDGTQVASQTITKNYFGSIRLSDGYWSVTTPADSANKVRCVAQTGGGSGSSSGWVDVPLAGTTPFDKTCEYRFYMNAMWLDAVYYAGAVASNQIVYVSHSSVTSSIPAANKSSYQVNGTPSYTVSKIEKRCN